MATQEWSSRPDARTIRRPRTAGRTRELDRRETPRNVTRRTGPETAGSCVDAFRAGPARSLQPFRTLAAGAFRRPHGVLSHLRTAVHAPVPTSRHAPHVDTR